MLPHRHLSAVREGSGCKEVKSFASVPQTSHPLCHPAEETSRWGKCLLKQAVGCGGMWDAEGDGYGDPYSSLGLGEVGCAPSMRSAAAVCGELR